MKSLIVVLAVFCAAQAFAGFGFGSNKMASPELVKEALANKHRYHFDDGGNISFGNGFFVRRFNFAGKAQVCHANNYIYAGVRKKCIDPIYSGENVTGCKKSKTVELKTQMVGTAQVCTDNQGDNGPCQKYATVKFSKGPKVKVAIFKKGQMSSESSMAGFKGFTYLTIPGCNF